MTDEQSYIGWCEFEHSLYQSVIKTTDCDSCPLVVVSEPPAGIQTTVSYISRAFSEQSQHMSELDERKI